MCPRKIARPGLAFTAHELKHWYTSCSNIAMVSIMSWMSAMRTVLLSTLAALLMASGRETAAAVRPVTHHDKQH